MIEHNSKISGYYNAAGDKQLADDHRFWEAQNAEQLAAADEELAIAEETAANLEKTHAVGPQGKANLELEAMAVASKKTRCPCGCRDRYNAARYGEDVEHYQAAVNKKAAMDAKYMLQVKTIQDQFTLSWTKVANHFTSNFNSGFEQWMNGQKRISAAMIQTWDHLAASVIMNMVKMAEQMAISYALHRAFAISEINLTAWNAAVGAYNALIGIPYVGPVLANVAFYGTYAFISGVAGSLAGGGVIPATDNYRLHENEMVMDPKLSGFIQKSFAGGEGGGGGDQHLHYYAAQGENPGSINRNLDALKRAKKDGKLKFLFAH